MIVATTSLFWCLDYPLLNYHRGRPHDQPQDFARHPGLYKRADALSHARMEAPNSHDAALVYSASDMAVALTLD